MNAASRTSTSDPVGAGPAGAHSRKPVDQRCIVDRSVGGGPVVIDVVRRQRHQGRPVGPGSAVRCWSSTPRSMRWPSCTGERWTPGWPSTSSGCRPMPCRMSTGAVPSRRSRPGALSPPARDGGRSGRSTVAGLVCGAQARTEWLRCWPTGPLRRRTGSGRRRSLCRLLPPFCTSPDGQLRSRRSAAPPLRHRRAGPRC